MVTTTRVETRSGERAAASFTVSGGRSAVVADLRGVYIIWFRDLLRWWRDRQRIVPSLFQPILYLFVFGVGLGSAVGAGIGGVPRGAPGAHQTPALVSGVPAGEPPLSAPSSLLLTRVWRAISGPP